VTQSASGSLLCKLIMRIYLHYYYQPDEAKVATCRECKNSDFCEMYEKVGKMYEMIVIRRNRFTFVSCD
jgi:hypothetical protein